MKYAAFLISSLIGYAISHFLLDGPAAAYASILISYHIYLAALVVFGLREKGFSMPIAMTIVTHSAFIAFLVGFAYARTHIPFFGLLSLLVPALAPFEANWLFGESNSKKIEAKQPLFIEPPTATVEDHEAFREYLKGEFRAFRKKGLSVEEEFNLWLMDRAKKKAEAEGAKAALSGSPSQPSRSGVAPSA